MTVWALGAAAGALLVAMVDTLVVWLLVEPHTLGPLYLIPLAAITVALVVWVVAAGGWMVWQVPMHTYIQTQISAQIKFGRNSVWWWLVPVANLVVPPMAVRQISAASRPDNRPAPITLVWWIGWVATPLSLILALTFGGPNRILLMAPVMGIGAVTAILAARVVLSIANASPAGIDRSQVTNRVRTLHLVVATLTSVLLFAVGSGFVFVMVEVAQDAMPAYGSQAGFEVGTCFDEPFLGDPDDVDCTEPHDAEVYSVLTYPAEAYPGDDDLWSWADGRCLLEFERTTGEEWVESDLDYWWFYPSESSWEDGDRTIQCYLVHFSGAKLVGSMLSGSEEPQSNA
ncbi:MAG: septum formation family protein [Acidimicrobiia bacterium]